MAGFAVEIVRLGEIVKHPNADSLGITQVYGYPVITRLGEFRAGDLAAYVPVEAVVPDTEQWAFLDGHRRIKAKKLRGTFSMGLLQPAPDGAEEGQDVAEAMGITKYEPPEKGAPGGPKGFDPQAEEGPAFIPRYTDIEHFRRYSAVLEVGEAIWATEKIHGCCARFAHDGDRLWVGTHRTFKRPDTVNEWRHVAEELGLARILANHPNKVFYGEVFGWVQDLRYGHKQGEVSLRFFDVYDASAGAFLDWSIAKGLLAEMGLAAVPELYHGPYVGPEQIEDLTLGQSILAANIREGVVIRPEGERWDHRCGRVVLKHISQNYLLRKGGTEEK